MVLISSIHSGFLGYSCRIACSLVAHLLLKLDSLLLLSWIILDINENIQMKKAYQSCPVELIGFRPRKYVSKGTKLGKR